MSPSIRQSLVALSVGSQASDVALQLLKEGK